MRKLPHEVYCALCCKMVDGRVPHYVFSVNGDRSTPVHARECAGSFRSRHLNDRITYGMEDPRAASEPADRYPSLAASSRNSNPLRYWVKP